MNAPFTAVICPEYAKKIEIDAAGATDVAIEQTLVFLEEPKPGDLRDVVPVIPDAGTEIRESPDAMELLRTVDRNGTEVYWAPREPIVPYALYVHSIGWSAKASPGEAALYTEFRCEIRTGITRVELVTPGTFETAVAFRWPRWRRLRSERNLVKYAFTQLESSEGDRPEILDNGSRLQWKLVAPRVGARYACVAFHTDGVALWQRRLEASSIPARMRRLLKAVTSF